MTTELYSWYYAEDSKRYQGLENEIDLNEIKQAAKGTVNKWHKALKRYPEAFSDYLKGARFNWQLMKEAKDLIK